jgi:hypothetical protein
MECTQANEKKETNLHASDIGHFKAAIAQTLQQDNTPDRQHWMKVSII